MFRRVLMPATQHHVYYSMPWALGYNVSIAAWVGMIALMGLDAETGVFMLLFLDLAHDEAAARGRLRTKGDLVEAIVHGG